MNRVYIIAATRSAIGTFGGSLKDTPPIDLGVHIAKSAIAQSTLAPHAIDHAVIGSVIHSEPRDMYIARCISIGAGMAESAPALTVNRLCGSGLQAIVSATQLIRLGDAETALAGGVEVMSRAGHLIPALRWGARMGDAEIHDMLLGSVTDPFGLGHMGITAENVAADYGISRSVQDAFALASQEKASAAQKAGHFTGQITPITVKQKKGAQKRNELVFQEDEHIRHNASLTQLEALRPIFQEGGTVTAGNASGINDGAAALVLASQTAVEKHGLKPLAEIIGYGFGGVAPRVMGMGPVPASKMALSAAGISLNDLAVIESNEAFAAQTCAVSKELGLPADKVNPNGGAIALGHPIGATGAIIMTKLVNELHRCGNRYGMATMCIGGGQGISVIIDAQV